MTFTAEQKSQLAKLLATENLTVQHQKIQTAKFDVKNRILYLPIWQNMSGVMYDLLVGHEVGHALYTPAEGWHDAVSDEDKNRNYKNFLNVIEDARIEKKVKRKYPGLNSAFKNAYQELNNRDFFGIKDRDVNEMPFIDRLNLFSKSQWTSTWIRFTAQEELMVKEVQAAETWDDVLRIANKVYEYSKEEQQEMQLNQFGIPSSDYDDDFGDDYEYDFDDTESSDDFQSDDNDESEKSGKETSSENSAKGKSSEFEDGEDEDESGGKKINHDKMSTPGDKDQFSPECVTDEIYRKNETKLLDDKCKEFVYLDIPKPNLETIITPAKRVHQLISESYNQVIVDKDDARITAETGKRLVNEFKNRNERYIGLLAKEFEMRKAAKSFSKSKLSDTGDIDINKLSSYKFDDNIFRKVLLTPKGKSHGLVLLLDRSGSMSKNMAGSIEQILVLGMFCRKVNIPFVVYGFTESADVRIQDLGIKGSVEGATFHRKYNYHEINSFTNNVGEFKFDNVQLREYLNSKMTNAEFSSALKNMCLLMEAYKEHNRYFPRPDSEQLHNTPMIQAIVASAEIMKEFKIKNNLDICSLVVIHDGDADHIGYFWDEKETEPGKIIKYSNWIRNGEKVYYMRDRANKFEKRMPDYAHGDAQSKCILEWFRKVTGARIFGFFIVPGTNGNIKNAIANRYVFEDGKTYDEVRSEVGWYNMDDKVKPLIKKFKTEKFLASKVSGYDNFFLIHGGNELTTDDEEFEIDGKFTAKKLATAFAKFNKKRAVNRVLVSRFIDGIAA